MSKRWLATVSLLIITFSLVAIGHVYAATTSPQCDSTPKYYCSYIAYTPESGRVTVTDRYYKGSLGSGGYTRWRVEFINDYEWDSSCSCYQLKYNISGPKAWQTNQLFPPSYSNDGLDRVLFDSGMVWIQFHHYDANNNFHDYNDTFHFADPS
jgi:hypothetical protein